MRTTICASLMTAAALCGWSADVKPLKPRAATASSTYEKYVAAKAVDGEASDASRWISNKSAEPAWLEIDLGARQKLAGVHLYSGYGAETPLAAFAFQYWSGDKWNEIPSAKVANNQAVALAIAFDDTVDVTTDKLRLWVTQTHQGMARVKEVVVWPASAGGVPPLPASAQPAAASKQADIAPLYLNQSGFNLGKPKRFTAPTLADGTRFAVRAAAGGAPLFEGALKGGVGDFSAFNPADGREYVVEAGGLLSVPFRIGPWWLERVSYQNAVNFMIDSRHHVGNVRAPCRGSYGWRDDHHFGWELHTLVPQYLSNPSAYDRMPRQVKYEKPSDAKLWGKLEPYTEEAPDLVKLIHWGADVIVTQELSHELLKSQLAYFLYAWPWLKPHLPEQNYAAVRDYAFARWADAQADKAYPYDESPEHNLLALKTKVGTTKGAYPPGFSVEPNLLLYEVAKRERRPDAERYFEAAQKQAAWLVAKLDWNDPLTTKGQRMSEFVTVTGLAHLLRQYPERAPAGLAAKLQEWARVAARRSENLWDFRKLDDADKWTPMGEKPTMWNEPGNVLGLPAALLAAREVIADPAVKRRLDELAYAHFDNGFGRNPVGRHFSFDAPREVEGVEHGWFSYHRGGIGQLADARFVIDGSPKDGHYPHHPEKGDIGWTEGWVQFNAAFNVSLAYLAFAETSLSLSRAGNEVVVRLRAPLNFDYEKAESGTVQVSVGGGPEQPLTVTEESASAFDWVGRLRAPAGARVDASYGYGYLARRASLIP